MFKCTLCYKAFTRQDSLSRHIKTLHEYSDIRKFSSNNQSENTAGHYLFDPINKQALNDVGNDLSESNYEGDESGRNNTDEDISQTLQNTAENNIAEHGIRLNPFEQRIQAATQAIQSKFDFLRSQGDIHKAGDENSNESTANEQKENLTASNNLGESTLIPKLTAFLQTALDIILIKELQSTVALDESEEDNFNRRTALKRSITLNSTEENENGQFPTKHIKYNNSPECENDNINTGQSQYVIKYWHNPYTLIDELKHLMMTTEIGQQIFKVMQSLEKNTRYFCNNIDNEKERKALTEKLNGLKQTSVGQAIFSIFRALQKVEIIEPNEDGSDYGESITDNEDEKENLYNTDDNK